MFCEKCGAKNEDNARFCEECGAVLAVEEKSCVGVNGIADSPEKTAFTAPDLDGEVSGVSFKDNKSLKTEKNPMSLKNKIIIAVVAVLVILCGLLYYFGKMATDPKKIVEKYLDSISSHEYAEAYECMDIESTEFTTKDLFVKVMENKNGENEADMVNYTIQEVLDQNPLVKEYDITYTRKGSSGISSMNVTLVKQASKKWLFYDDYKIAEDGLIAKDYSITVPEGTEVYIDDIKVDEKYEEEPDTSYSSAIKEKTYTIPSIFVGIHKIKVSSPFSKDYVFDEYIEDGGYTNVYGVELTDTAKAEVPRIAEEFVGKYATSAIGKKSLDELKTYFSADADMDNIQDDYDDLMDYGVNEEGFGVKSITFDRSKSTAEEEYKMGSSYCVSVDYEYNYTALKENWFEETIEEYTPDSLHDGSANIYFVYEDGKWKISDFYINIYMYY